MKWLSYEVTEWLSDLVKFPHSPLAVSHSPCHAELYIYPFQHLVTVGFYIQHYGSSNTALVRFRNKFGMTFLPFYIQINHSVTQLFSYLVTLSPFYLFTPCHASNGSCNDRVWGILIGRENIGFPTNSKNVKVDKFIRL